MEEEIDPETLVPRVEYVLLAPPGPPVDAPAIEQLMRRLDFDRLWDWTGSEALRAIPAYVREHLRECFLDDDARTEPIPWMRPYVSAALAAVELSVYGRPLRLWAARTRLGLAVATDADLAFEIIPALRQRLWE